MSISTSLPRLQDGLPHLTQLNNGILTAIKAMPQKDLTTVNESSFAIDREQYPAFFPNATTNSQYANQKWLPSGRTIRGRHTATAAVSFVQGSDPTNNGKKWMANSNRDASRIAIQNRVRELGNGSLNASAVPTSFETGSNYNTINNAKIRCRSGGSCVPVKVRAATHTANSSPIFTAGNLVRTTSSYVCGPSPLEKLRLSSWKSTNRSCQEFTTPFIQQTNLNKMNFVGKRDYRQTGNNQLFSIPTVAH